MKVLYDHQAFTMQYFGGVSKCFCELISHFPNGVETEISIVQSDNVHLKQSGLCGKLHPVDIDSYKFREQYNFRGAYRYRMRNIYHVNQQIRFTHLIQCRFKRIDQICRQLTDKPLMHMV